MVQPYPQAGDIDVATYARADADIEWLKAMVSAVRRIRSELGVSPSKQVSLLVRGGGADATARIRSEEHTSELQSLMRISYAVFGLKKQNRNSKIQYRHMTERH